MRRLSSIKRGEEKSAAALTRSAASPRSDRLPLKRHAGRIHVGCRSTRTISRGTSSSRLILERARLLRREEKEEEEGESVYRNVVEFFAWNYASLR